VIEVKFEVADLSFVNFTVRVLNKRRDDLYEFLTEVNEKMLSEQVRLDEDLRLALNDNEKESYTIYHQNVMIRFVSHHLSQLQLDPKREKHVQENGYTYTSLLQALTEEIRETKNTAINLQREWEEWKRRYEYQTKLEAEATNNYKESLTPEQKKEIEMKALKNFR
jgi:ABC-type Zn uptake system ZnuABC Zn-binding protein ZnuA